MYQYAGIEYGRECWCGDTLDLGGNRSAVTVAAKVVDSECDFRCPGNQAEFCGGRVRLSLYARLED
jgi:hypothetical protein